MTRIALLLVWWGTSLVVGALTWPGPDAGLAHEINVVMVLVAGTLLINAAGFGASERPDPVLGMTTRLWWVIYAGVAVAIAVLGARATAALVVIAHLVNLGLALAVALMSRRMFAAVRPGLELAASEQDVLLQLTNAVHELEADSRTWTAVDTRDEVDVLLRQLRDALRFAPRRVPGSRSSRVEDMCVVVSTTRQRLAVAQGKPGEWFVAEVRACVDLVIAEVGLLDHAVASSGRRQP